MRIVVSPAAKRDRQDAESYYGSASPGALTRFRLDLRAALKYVATYPQGAPIVYRQTRGKTMHRYPYTIFYVVEASAIVVLAIANEHRDPAVYRARLR